MSPCKVFLLSTILVACGSSVVSPEPLPMPPTPELPKVYGRPVSLTDVAALDADSRELFRLYEERMPSPHVDNTQTPAAISKVSARWLTSSVQTMKSMQEKVSILASRGPSERLFASVILGAFLDELATSIRQLPAPDSLPEDGKAQYKKVLESQALPIARQLPSIWEACTASATQLVPPLSEWASECATKRDDVIAWITPLDSATEAKPKPPVAAWSAKCTDGFTYRRDPLADPPNESKPMRLAVFLDTELSRLSAKDQKRFITVVAKKVGGDIGAKLVSHSVFQRAKKLLSQKKLTKGGPVCGQAPSLEDILSQTYPHLAVAYASVDSFAGEGRSHLFVSSSKPGTGRHKQIGHWESDLPLMMLPDARSKTLLSAAANLKKGGGVSSILGMLMDQFQVRVLDDAEESPWLRVGNTFYGSSVKKALEECAATEGLYVANVRFDVNADGSTSAHDVVFSETPDTSNSEALKQCVTAAISTLSMPCTRSGQTEPVDITLCMRQAGPRDARRPFHSH